MDRSVDGRPIGTRVTEENKFRRIAKRTPRVITNYSEYTSFPEVPEPMFEFLSVMHGIDPSEPTAPLFEYPDCSAGSMDRGECDGCSVALSNIAVVPSEQLRWPIGGGSRVRHSHSRPLSLTALQG